MTQRGARRLLLLLIAAFAAAVVWPGVALANRYRPTVAGLPFTVAWVALWILIGLAVLLAVDHALYAKPPRSGTDRTG